MHQQSHNQPRASAGDVDVLLMSDVESVAETMEHVGDEEVTTPPALAWNSRSNSLSADTILHEAHSERRQWSRRAVFAIQATLSFLVMIFCFIQLVLNHVEAVSLSCGETTWYQSTIIGIIGYWFPSPVA